MSAPTAEVPAGVTTTVPLQAVERFLSVSSRASAIIAHVFALTVAPTSTTAPPLLPDAAALAARMPAAFRRVVQRHPRMRALQSREDPLVSVVLDDVPLTVVESLVEVRTDVADWQAYAVRVVNEPRDRCTHLPFRVHVLLPPTPEVATAKEDADVVRFIVFSDHYMSDGISGLIVFNELLAELAIPAADACAADRPPVESLPVPQPLFSVLNERFSSLYLRLERLAFRLICPLVLRDMAGTRPAIPLDPSLVVDFDGKDPTLITTRCLFASGDKDALDAALSACRANQTTLHGAILACCLAAAASVSVPAGVDPAARFRFAIDVDYDWRRRRRPSAAADTTATVGYQSNLATLGMPRAGVRLGRTGFWALARQLKHDTDTAPRTFLRHRALQLLFQEHFIARRLGGLPRFPGSTVGDLNVSNLTRYPFTEAHVLSGLAAGGGGGDCHLALRSLHFFNGMPLLSNAAILFISSTAGSLDYSLIYRWSDAHARSFFDAFCALIAAVGSASADETAHGFAKRVLGR